MSDRYGILRAVRRGYDGLASAPADACATRFVRLLAHAPARAFSRQFRPCGHQGLGAKIRMDL